jgi:hypothetical protein
MTLLSHLSTMPLQQRAYDIIRSQRVSSLALAAGSRYSTPIPAAASTIHELTFTPGEGL